MAFVASAMCVLVAMVLVATPAAAASSRYAAYVIDAATGEVLHQESANRELFPASLTKMMTLYLTFRALQRGEISLDTRITVSGHAAAQPPSKLGLSVGSRIRVEDAILAIVTKSANDIAVVLGEALGGTEGRFAQLMTQQARALGMSRTSFRNASGLPNPDQLSTAHDMAVLARALITDYPQYYGYFSTRNFRYRGANYHNHNRLMDGYDGMDGLKTGYIRASGFNLVGSAMRGGRRLIAVVFGGESAASRNARVAELLDAAFEARGISSGTFVADRSGAPFRPPLPGRRPDGRVLLASAGGDDAIAQIIEDAGSSEPATAASVLSAGGSPVPEALRAVPLPKPLPVLRRAALGVAVESSAADPAVLPEILETVEMAGLPAAWSIQIGAYPSRTDGEAAIDRAAAQVPALLTAADRQLMPVDTGASEIYRARFVGLGQQTAGTACARLMEAGTSCVAIAPSGPLAPRL